MSEKKTIKEVMIRDIKQLEDVVESLRNLFRYESATVDGEHLTLDNLGTCRAFIVSYQARAATILGQVKGICARGEARLKQARAKAYIDVRVYKGRKDSLEQEQDAPPIKSPSQKDAEIIAQDRTAEFQLEVADWEGLLARISGINDTLKNYGDAIKELVWVRRAEEKNYD